VSARPADRLVLGGEPRVQLLPQSVRDKEKAAITRRRLAMLVVLAIVLVGGGYGLAWMRNGVAQQQLETARQATEVILAEQAQYSEGTRASALVAGITAARQSVTVNEIAWADVVGQIAALAPQGTTLDAATMVAQAGWEPPLSVEGPLRTPRIALLTLSFGGPSPIDAAALTLQLSQLKGYVDSRFDSSILGDDGRYVTVIRIMLDSDAASGRFAATPDGSETAAPADGSDESAQAEGATR
jgi:type II secretory pathway pseudopilin PulG